jgi:zinc/manganese transport system substrate-binding protein
MRSLMRFEWVRARVQVRSDTASSPSCAALPAAPTLPTAPTPPAPPPPHGCFRPRRVAGGTALAAAVALAASACTAAAAVPADGVISAVGAENQYANVIAQIGGKYVTVAAVMSNPNTDPHTFEASSRIAQTISSAQLVVQNGLGYDSFMDSIESATGGSGRTVIDVQSLTGLPDSTANPHLWYRPSTMPAVAKAVADDLSSLEPDHAAYFRANLAGFDASLDAWNRALAAFSSAHPDTPIATTEPVADYLLQAAGTRDLTPWNFQADVMNGVDPSPQDVTLQENLLKQHKVKVFLYNQQVTDTLTESLLTLARQNGIPVVGVYETMPDTGGYDYQTWMVAEVKALDAAVTSGQSTVDLS